MVIIFVKSVTLCQEYSKRYKPVDVIFFVYTFAIFLPIFYIF